MNSPSYDADLALAMQNLKTLGLGDTYVYFVGFLDEERLLHKNGMGVKLADLAYSLMLEGKVHLTQRRLGPPTLRNGEVDWSSGAGRGFRYIATGASPKNNKPRITFAQIAGGWRP